MVYSFAPRIFAFCCGLILGVPLSYADDAQDCKGTDKKTVIRGCTALINSGTQSGLRFEVVHFNRGMAYSNSSDYEKAVADFDQSLKIDPNFARSKVEKASALSKLGKLDEALTVIQDAVKTNPKRASAHDKLGDILYDQGDYPKAKQAYDAAIALSPKTALTFYDRGFTHIRLEQYAEAIADFEKSLLLEPELDGSYFGLGNVYSIQKDFEKAIAAYEKSIALNPASGEYFNSLGDALYATGRFEKAIAAYSVAIKNNQNNHDDYYERGYAYLSKNDPTTSRADFEEAIRQSPGVAAYHGALGFALNQEKSFDKAIVALTAALAIDDGFIEALIQRASAFTEKLELDLALKDLNKAISLDAKNLEAIIDRANIQYSRSDFDAASDDAKSALSLDPNSAFATTILGFVAFEKGEMENALALFDKSTVLDPKFASAYTGRAEIYIARNQFDKAAHEIDLAFAAKPNGSFNYSGRGNIRLATGDLSGALQDLDKAIALDSLNGDAFLSRGKVYAQQGEKEKALADWREVLVKYRATERIQKLAALEISKLEAVSIETVAEPTGSKVDSIGQKAITATTGKRLALVIGNGRYQNSSSLVNPPKDSRAMASLLTKMGFEVIEGEDLDKTAMEAKLRSFAQKATLADVTLFFYAGHGMQVGDKNYLIPVDAKLEEVTAVDFELIDVDKSVVKYLGGDSKTGIVILDSCRDNPLARSFARSFGKSRNSNTSRGMAPMSTEDGGLLIAFATSPGDVAADGEGDNSPFTTALLKHLPTPGLELELLMKRVKKDVYDNTSKNQQPWVNSALRDEIYLVGQ